MNVNKLRVSLAFIISIFMLLPIPLVAAQPAYSSNVQFQAPKIPIISKEHLKLHFPISNASIFVVLNPNWTFVNLTTYFKTINNSKSIGKALVLRESKCSYNLTTSFTGYDPELNMTSITVKANGNYSGERRNDIIYIHSVDNAMFDLYVTNKSNSISLASWAKEVRDLSFNTTSGSISEHSIITSNLTKLVLVQSTKGKISLNITNFYLDYWSKSWKEGKAIKSIRTADISVSAVLFFSGVPIPVGTIRAHVNSSATITKINTTNRFNVVLMFSDSNTANLFYNIITQIVSSLGLSKNITVSKPTSTEIDIKGTLVQKARGINKVMMNKIASLPPVPFSLLAKINMTSFNASYSSSILENKGNFSIKANALIKANCSKEPSYRLNYLKISTYHKEGSNYTEVNMQLNVTHPEPISSFLMGKAFIKRIIDKVRSSKGSVNLVVKSISKDIMFKIGNKELSKIIFTNKNISEALNLNMIYNGVEVGGSGGLLKIITAAKKITFRVPVVTKEVYVRGPENIMLVLPSKMKLFNNLTISVTNNLATNASVTLFPGSIVNSTFSFNTITKQEAMSLIPRNISAYVIGPALSLKGVSGSGLIKLPIEEHGTNVELLIIVENGTYKIFKNVTVENGYLIAKVHGFSTFIPVLVKGETPTSTSPTTTTTTSTSSTSTSTTTTSSSTTTTTTTTTSTSSTTSSTSTTSTTSTTSSSTTTSTTTSTTSTTSTMSTSPSSTSSITSSSSPTSSSTSSSLSTSSSTSTSSSIPSTTKKAMSHTAVVAAIIIIILVILVGIALLLRR